MNFEPPRVFFCEPGLPTFVQNGGKNICVLFQSLVGKIEKIGISNLMTGPGALSISGGMYARPALSSPMTQLTCLLPSHSNEDLTTTVGTKRAPPVDTSPGKLGQIFLIFLQSHNLEE